MLIEAIEDALLAVDTAYALSQYGKTIRPLDIFKEIQNQLIKQNFANRMEVEVYDEAQRLLSNKEFMTRIYLELEKYKTPFEEPK